MPHSTTSSCSSTRTFTLDSDTATSNDMSSASSKRPASGSLGMALTSNPPVEDKARLSFGLHSKRDSTAVDDAYASLVGQNHQHVDVGLSKPVVESTNHRLSHGDSVRRRTSEYERSWASREAPKSTAREKILLNSPVIAELKTNVIIKDEFTLVTDLSYHLAQRYSRPESCIMVKVDHSACLAFGGGFEPCYIMSISAIPAQVGAWSNRRNAALIQAFMSDILSVPADRGVVRFESVQEECYAINGNTVQGQLDKVDRLQDEEMRRPTTSPHRKSITSFTRSSGGADSRTNSWTNDDKNARPSTSHGSTSHSFSFDNLRLNRMSLDQLTSSTKVARLSGGRPKTLGADTSTTHSDFVKSVPERKSSNALSTTQPSSKPLKSNLRATNAKSPSPTLSPTLSLTSLPKPASPPSTQRTSVSVPSEIQPRNNYLNNIATITKRFETRSSTSDSKGRDTTANTAKRRSTLTSGPTFTSSSLSSSAAITAATTAAAAATASVATNTADKPAPSHATETSPPKFIPPPPRTTPAHIPITFPPPPPEPAVKSASKSLRSFRLGGRRKNIIAAIRRGFRDDSAVGS